MRKKTGTRRILLSKKMKVNNLENKFTITTEQTHRMPKDRAIKQPRKKVRLESYQPFINKDDAINQPHKKARIESHEEIINKDDDQLNQAFKQASAQGHLPVVQFLMKQEATAFEKK